MDGTLIDSREAVLGSFKHVLERHGLAYDEKTASSHVGKLLEHTYEAMAPKHDAKALSELHRNWQIANKHLFKGFEGLNDFLNSLKKKGLKIGAYTSANRIRTEVMLEIVGGREFFNAMVCGDEVTHPKPHREGVEKVAKMLGVDKDEVVFVGDSEHDILSGKNAGVITIGVTHGFGTKEALEEAGADHIVNNLRELQKVIESLMLDNGK